MLKNRGCSDLIIHTAQAFTAGSRFQHIDLGAHANKTGTVNYLRDDTYEKQARIRDPSHHYYSVKFDDGTSETYLSQMYMFAPVK